MTQKSEQHVAEIIKQTAHSKIVSSAFAGVYPLDGEQPDGVLVALFGVKKSNPMGVNCIRFFLHHDDTYSIVFENCDEQTMEAEIIGEAEDIHAAELAATVEFFLS